MVMAGSLKKYVKLTSLSIFVHYYAYEAVTKKTASPHSNEVSAKSYWGKTVVQIGS